jgi:hypothetical protein
MSAINAHIPIDTSVTPGTSAHFTTNRIIAKITLEVVSSWCYDRTISTIWSALGDKTNTI